jgi:tetratricopeptide (TPR) repeat protein
MQRPANSKLDLALARDLALRNGIRAIVDGDITGLGAGGYIVTMKLVTTDSAKELASFRETAASAPDLIEAVDALARQLRGRVGESLKRVREAPNLARATTASLEALRKYTEGTRLEQQTTRRNDAIALLQEAVKIDTAFAEGWRKLAIVMGNAGRPRPQLDSAWTQAYRFRDRVPETARNMIVAGYYNNGPGRDRGRAVAAYEEVLRNGDTLGGAANNLALILSQRREFARAESLYRAQIRLDPKMFRTTFLNLIITQLRQEKFSAAESTVALAVSHFPDLEVETRRGSIDNLFRTGDTAAFRRVVDSIFTNGDSTEKAWARTRVQNLALLDGRASRWRRMNTETRPATPNPRQRLNFALQSVDNEISVDWLKRPNEVTRRLDEALAGFRGPLGPSDYLNVSSLYAYVERPDKARPYLARFDAEVRDTALKRQMAPAIANATADVLVAEGKGLEAVEQYRRGDRMPDGPVNSCLACLPLSLAYAFDKAGVVDSAIKYHQAYVTTYDLNRFGMDPRYLALMSKRLGELYEQKGNREKAAKYYNDFVNLWKNADPELQPQVAEVKRKLSRLADIERR